MRADTYRQEEAKVKCVAEKGGADANRHKYDCVKTIHLEYPGEIYHLISRMSQRKRSFTFGAYGG